jgi:HSP20 family protein
MALPVRVSRQQYSDPYDLMRQDFGDVMGRLFGSSLFGGEGSMMAPYGVDIREDADHIFVEADLPGFNKDDVDVSLENGTLTISAEKQEQRQTPQPHEAKGQGQKSQGQPQHGGGPEKNYLLRERHYNRFIRSFNLPSTVDESHVNAKLDNGCLTITLNKREETKPKKITVA